MTPVLKDLSSGNWWVAI